jgi:hypothetical protein
MPCDPRGPDGDPQAVASRPRSRKRRRCAPPRRGGRYRPAGPPSPETKRSALASQFPQSAADGVLRARADLTAARTKERFFASQATSWWPIWPLGAPRPSDPLAARNPEHCANAANSWIPADGRSWTRTRALFLIRKTSCRLQSPNSQIIPANGGHGARGRRLETTGGDKLVAPSWPHGHNSRPRLRVTRKRTSHRRYGHARTLRRRAAASLPGWRRPP